jgi:hypothetical protein
LILDTLLVLNSQIRFDFQFNADADLLSVLVWNVLEKLLVWICELFILFLELLLHQKFNFSLFQKSLFHFAFSPTETMTVEQPINEYDAVTLGIQIPVALYSIIMLPYQIWLLYKERNTAFVKYRGFWNCVFTQIGNFCMTFGVSITTLFNAPCWVFNVFCIFGGLLASFSVLEKAFLLHVHHTVAKMTKDVVRNDGPKSWYFRHRTKLLNPSPFSMTKMMVFGATSLLLIPALVFTFGVYHDQMSYSWYTEECLGAGVNMVIVLTVLLGISNAPMGIIMKKLKDVEENYLMMYELNATQPILGIAAVAGILYVSIPNVRQLYKRPVLFQYLLCSLIAQIVGTFSSVVVLFKNRRLHRESNSSHHSARNLMLKNNEQATTVEIKVSGPDTPGSDGRPSSPSSPTHNKGSDKMRQILADEKGFAAFEKFLVKELSTENLHCWKAIEVLRERYQETGEAGSEGLWKNAMKIYDLFCHPNAAVPVNISSQSISHLKQLFPDGCKYDPTSFPDIFKALTGVQQELFILMNMDSFRRFKRSDLYAGLQIVDL